MKVSPVSRSKLDAFGEQNLALLSARIDEPMAANEPRRTRTGARIASRDDVAPVTAKGRSNLLAALPEDVELSRSPTSRNPQQHLLMLPLPASETEDHHE